MDWTSRLTAGRTKLRQRGSLLQLRVWLVDRCRRDVLIPIRIILIVAIEQLLRRVRCLRVIRVRLQAKMGIGVIARIMPQPLHHRRFL